MTTWGPSKKQTAKSRTSRAPSASGAEPGTSRGTAAAGRRRRPRQPAGVEPADQATDELRSAVDGREHEFIGIALIVGGVLIGLAIYFDLAGPLGRGVETLLGWLVGLGRYAIPVVLVAAGVALVRKGQSSSPVRLAIGWALVGRRRRRHRPRRQRARRVRRPRRHADAPAGSSVRSSASRCRPCSPRPAPSSCCSASASAARCSITRTSLRTMAMRTGAGRRLGRPAARPRRPPGAARPVVAEQRPRRRRRRRPHRRHRPTPRAAAAAAASTTPPTTSPTPPRARKPDRPPGSGGPTAASAAESGAPARRVDAAAGRATSTAPAPRPINRAEVEAAGRVLAGVARPSTASRRRSSA